MGERGKAWERSERDTFDDLLLLLGMSVGRLV